MEAKDTIITQDQFEEWCGTHQIKGCGRIRDMCEKVCRPLAQIEITWDIAFEAGRKGEVEWMNRYRVDDTAGLPTFILSANEWQAKLKEGGMEERQAD